MSEILFLCLKNQSYSTKKCLLFSNYMYATPSICIGRFVCDCQYGRCVGGHLTKAIVLQTKPGLAVFISLGNFFLSQHKGCTKVGHTKLRVSLSAENSLMYCMKLFDCVTIYNVVLFTSRQSVL
jgi:hypothetical protein